MVLERPFFGYALLVDSRGAEVGPVAVVVHRELVRAVAVDINDVEDPRGGPILVKDPTPRGTSIGTRPRRSWC